MKKFVTGLFFILLFLFTEKTTAQDIPQYDYLEVILVQKANNQGKIKRIRVEEQSSLEGKLITIDDLEEIKETSTLLNYMNRANWEFIDRQAVVSDNNDPVWMSYIFRKRK